MGNIFNVKKKKCLCARLQIFYSFRDNENKMQD